MSERKGIGMIVAGLSLVTGGTLVPAADEVLLSIVRWSAIGFGLILVCSAQWWMSQMPERDDR